MTTFLAYLLSVGVQLLDERIFSEKRFGRCWFIDVLEFYKYSKSMQRI